MCWFLHSKGCNKSVSISLFVDKGLQRAKNRGFSTEASFVLNLLGQDCITGNDYSRSCREEVKKSSKCWRSSHYLCLSSAKFSKSERRQTPDTRCWKATDATTIIPSLAQHFDRMFRFLSGDSVSSVKIRDITSSALYWVGDSRPIGLHCRKRRYYWAPGRSNSLSRSQQKQTHLMMSSSSSVMTAPVSSASYKPSRFSKEANLGFCLDFFVSNLFASRACAQPIPLPRYTGLRSTRRSTRFAARMCI